MAVLASLFILSLPFEASARPAICGKLERQLASAGSNTGLGSDKYSRAAREQMQQLRIARGQANSAGCRGVGSFESNKATCNRISNTIRKMESNLAKLQSKAKGGTTRSDRSRILAALDANDCNGRVIDDIVVKQKKPTLVKSKPDNFFTVLFGGSKEPKRIKTTYDKTTYDVASAEKPKTKKTVTVINGGKKSDARIDYTGGTFRTICVRTCDGYYFPVSFSTTSSRFPADEKACAAMCPGSETKLYYHSVPDQEPEEMISLRKEPYAALPTAFQYRRDGVGTIPGCTCQAASAEVTDEANATPSSKTIKKWIPYPSFKPSQFEDEESRFNRVGGLTAESIQELLASKIGAKTLAAQQNVRVVGPEFLPSQSTATSLQVPGRLSVQ